MTTGLTPQMWVRALHTRHKCTGFQMPSQGMGFNRQILIYFLSKWEW